MKLFCQWTLLALTFASVLYNLYTDFHGRKQKEPGGFQGAVITLIGMAVLLFIYKTAGAFSEIWTE